MKKTKLVLLLPLLWLLAGAQSLKGQNICDHLSASIQYPPDDPCLFRLQFMCTTECIKPVITVALSTSSFNGWSASSNWTGQPLSPSVVQLTYNGPFIPTGTYIPFGFRLLPGVSPTLLISYENQCGTAETCFLETTVDGCPDPEDASITGIKYRECSALPYSNQPVLAGWTIELYDQSGSLKAQAVTDGLGQYQFFNLKGDTYTVKEVQQPGWTAAFPSSGQATINLAPSTNVSQNFGNCQVCSCDAIYFAVSPKGSVQDTCCYNLNVQNTAGTCYNSILIELSGTAKFSSSLTLLPGWQAQSLSPQRILLFAPGPKIPTGNLTPLSFCVTGSAVQDIAVSTFWTSGPDDYTCSSNFSFNCPPASENCCPAGFVQGSDQIVNGNFENGTGFGTDYTLSATCNPGRYNVLTGPQLPGMCPEWGGVDHTFGNNTGKMLAADGSQTPGRAVWRQQLTITKDTKYAFCAYVNNLNRTNQNAADPIVEAWIVNGIYPNNTGGTKIATSNVLPESPDNWVQISGLWTAPSVINQPYYLEIRTSGTSFAGNNFAVDDISFRSCSPPPCKADFTVTAIDSCGAFQITGTSTGSQPITYQWCDGNSAPSYTAFFPPCNTYTVCVSITDGNGCMSSATQTFSVTDNIPPVAKCVPGFGVDLAANCTVSLTPAIINAGSTDNCEIASIDINPTTLTGCGDFPVQLTVTDRCGNTSTCSTSIQTIEVIAPVIVCPPAMVVQGNPLLGGIQITLPPPATLTDNCSTPSYTYDPENGLFPCGTQTTVTYTASDACGNTATCTMSVTVLDCVPQSMDTCCAFGLAFINKYTDGRIKSVRVSGTCDTRICCADPDEWAQDATFPDGITWYPADGSPVPNGVAIDNDFLIYLSGTGVNNIQVEWIDQNSNVVCRHQIQIACDGVYSEDEDWSVYTSTTSLNDPNLFVFAYREEDDDGESICDPEERDAEECSFTHELVCVGGSSYGVTLHAPPGYDQFAWVVGSGPSYPNISSGSDPSFTVGGNGSYVISLQARSSTTGSVCAGIEDINIPTIDADFKSKYIPCSDGLKYEFTAFGWDNQLLVKTVEWFCNPTVSNFPTSGDVVDYTFPTAGSYTVTVIITDIFGCQHSKDHEIIVSQQCRPDFKIDSYTFCKSSCNGGSNQTVTVKLQNLSSGGKCGVKYTWSDGINPAVTSHELDEFVSFTVSVPCLGGNSSYPITLKMEDNQPQAPNCMISTTKSVSITPCDVDFDITVCPDGRVNFKSKNGIYGIWTLPNNNGIAPWPYSDKPHDFAGRKEYIVARYSPGFHVAKFKGQCPDGGECEILKEFEVPNTCCAKNDKDKLTQYFTNGSKQFKFKAKLVQNQYPLFVHNIRVVTKLKSKKTSSSFSFYKNTKGYTVESGANGQIFYRDKTTKCNCVIPDNISPYKSLPKGRVVATEHKYFKRFRSMKGSIVSTHTATVGSITQTINLSLGKQCDKFQWWFDWF